MGGKNWKKGKPEKDVIHTEIKGGMDKRTENRGGDAASWLNLENSEGFTCTSRVMKASHTPGGKGR